MSNLFVYGSLMFDAVWHRVVGSGYRRSEAKLAGFRRLRICGKTYPGLVSGSVDEQVTGVLVHGLSRQDLTVLDRFEQPLYARRLVRVQPAAGADPVRAWVYVTRDRYRHRLVAAEWDPEEFRQRHLPAFLRHWG